MAAQVWFVTGASSGLGLDIALKALEAGQKVIGTVRSKQRAASAVARIEGKGGKVVELDVANAASCSQSWAEASQIYGPIDVLVNNAGVSFLGVLEDFTDEEVHEQMNVNVYGPIRLMRAALPSFRQRRSGTIVNVTSIAGIDALPSSALYAASKFALEGLSEGLAREVADYDVKVLIVEPGAFRTNFLAAFKTNSQASLGHYTAAKAMLDKLAAWQGKQPGDPVKAAERIVGAVTGSGIAGSLKGQVLRLPLGPDCVARYEAKVKNMTSDLEACREVAMGTDID